jgi:hypothetical protein
MKDGLIRQKAVAQRLVRWLVQSQAEPQLSRLPNCSWARLKLSLAPWLSRAEPSYGNTSTVLYLYAMKRESQLEAHHPLKRWPGVRSANLIR